MFTKLLITLVAATLIAAVLLDYRQQRLETMHEMARLHRRIDELRQQTWDRQVRIAQALEPRRFGQSLGRSGMAFHPVIPTGVQLDLLRLQPDEPEMDGEPGDGAPEAIHDQP
ncbi:MAG: hypothetical protein WD009_12515 [Phycisphaeraceae bacterium]